MFGIISLHISSFLLLLSFSKSSRFWMFSGGGSFSLALFAISFLIAGSISLCGFTGVSPLVVLGSVVVGVPLCFLHMSSRVFIVFLDTVVTVYVCDRIFSSSCVSGGILSRNLLMSSLLHMGFTLVYDWLLTYK